MRRAPELGVYGIDRSTLGQQIDNCESHMGQVSVRKLLPTHRAAAFATRARRQEKSGPARAPKKDGAVACLLDRSSVESGGRMTSLRSMGKAFSSTLKPGPSLWGEATPFCGVTR